jgi:hypothetical protein
VTVGGVGDCGGYAEKRVKITPLDIKVGYMQPSRTTCDAITNKPPLRKNTLVRITKIPNSNTQINFGCAFNGCIHDANGRNSPAAAPFPFVGLREFSLVIKVGTQVVQGGTNVSFKTNQAGPLEICVNDPDLFNNTGAWGINVRVDDLGS